MPFWKLLNKMANDQGAEDYRLKWDGDQVRILTGKAIPGEGIAKATTSGRRKRFKTAMEQEMSSIGWEPVPNKAPNTYRRS